MGPTFGAHGSSSMDDVLLTHLSLAAYVCFSGWGALSILQSFYDQLTVYSMVTSPSSVAAAALH